MEALRNAGSKFRFALSRSPLKEACAEFLGTFFLVLCGNGVMAAITLGRVGNHAVLVSAVGWGLALMIGVSIAGGISGGHLNPAVSVAFATVRKCPWKNVLYYMMAQYHAGIFAAAVIYLVYADAITEFDNGIRQIPPEPNSTAQIFSTFPQDFASIGSCFVDQVVGSALLLIVVCAATDKKNLRMPPHIQSVVIGLGLTAVCLAFGYNCGAPLNPARDLAPRLFSAFLGWGWKVFSYRSYTWFLIPVVGPHVGACLGVWLYDFFIDMPFRNYVLLTEELERVECSEEAMNRTAVDAANNTSARVVVDDSLSTENSASRNSVYRSSTEEEKSGEVPSQKPTSGLLEPLQPRPAEL